MARTPASARWRGNWAALAVGALCRSALLSVAVMLLWSLAPALLGWHTTMVMTGSMAPRLVPGDVAVARPVEPGAVHLGQVLLVDDPDHPGRLRLHRLVDVRDGQFVLRGDANGSDDSSTVAPSAVRGIAVLRIPGLASPVVSWAEGDRGPAATAVVLTVALAAGAAAFRPGPERGALPPFPYPPASRRWPRRAAVLTVAVAAVGALQVGTPAWAAYGGTAVNGTNGIDANAYYTCVNATYDGTSAAPGSARAVRAYALQEASGSTATNTGSTAGNGTYVAAPTLGATGPANCGTGGTKAVTLNGTSQYVNTATAAPTLTDSTVEVWFRSNDTNGGRLVGLGSSSTAGVASTTTNRTLYTTATGQIAFGVLSGTTKTGVVSPASYNNGAWHLATATVSSTGTSLYLDGALVASNTTSSATTATGYVRIGWDSLSGWPSAPTNLYFAGSLAHAAVYSVALTGAQARAHYVAGL